MVGATDGKAPFQKTAPCGILRHLMGPPGAPDLMGKLFLSWR